MKSAFARLSLALAAAVTATLPLATQAANPVQTLRADYGAVLDSLETSLVQNGNTRGLKLLQQSRFSLNTVSDANFARLFEGGLPELTSTVGDLKQYSMKARAKSAGLPAASGIHSACSSNPYDAESVYASLIASQVTSSILAAATFVCTQDVLGANGSAACIPFAIADDIAQGIFAVRSWCAVEAGGAKSDASFERLSHVHDDLADARSTILSTASANLTAILNNSNANTLAVNNNIDAKATAIVNNANSNLGAIVNNANSNTTSIINTSNANKDAIVGELRALACELIRLMNTPDGQRSSSVAQCSAAPGFPYSWNKK